MMADKNLFQQAMAGVKPLAKRKTLPPTANPPAKRPAAEPVSAQQAALPVLGAGENRHVDGANFKKFRKGKKPIDAKLDLHGLTQAQAHAKLNQFIIKAAASGKRSVLIITGKGRQGQGVLRQYLPFWLNHPDLRPYLLAFSQALPQDGGDGAFYVLLKRRRSV
ncbi:MAG: Smr/MutS family protein [Dongiaceae bacterium]